MGIPPLALAAARSRLDPGFGAEQFAAAVRASNEQLIPPQLVLAIYLPFCRTLCYHCERSPKVTRNVALTERYLDTLGRELEAKAALFDRDRSPWQVWLIGGNPLCLAETRLGRLLDQIRGSFGRFAGRTHEVMIEAVPSDMRLHTLERLSHLGVNALRMEVPTLQRVVQRHLNRYAAPEAIADTICAARDAGFVDIQLGCRYGLPDQGAAGFGRDLEVLASSGPDSLFVLPYRHRPDRHPAQRLLPADRLPNEDRRQKMHALADDLLRIHGYVNLGLGHYALRGTSLYAAQRQGTLRRSVLGFVAGAGVDVVGVGAGALSSVGDRYFVAPSRVEAYLAGALGQRLGAMSGYLCSAREIQAGFVAQRLLSAGVCDKADFERRFGIGFDHAFATRRQAWTGEHDGIEDCQGELRLTPFGRQNLDKVLAALERRAA